MEKVVVFKKKYVEGPEYVELLDFILSNLYIFYY